MPRISGLSIEHEIGEMLGIRNVLIRGIAYRYQALLGKTRGWSNQRIIRCLNLSARLIEDQATGLSTRRHNWNLPVTTFLTGN